MSAQDILKPKSRREIWKIIYKRHFVLIIGIPTMLFGLTMAITLLSCIPGSSYAEYHDIAKTEWLEATGDSTFVDFVPEPYIETPKDATKAEADSIDNLNTKRTTDKYVVLEIIEPVKEPIKLPYVFKKNVNFFKRYVNVSFVGVLILMAVLMIILPIISMVRRYGYQAQQNNNNYRGYYR